MATIKGIGTKFGVGVFTLTPSGGTVIVNTTKAALQSRVHRRSSQKAELTGEDGDADGLVYYNVTNELTLTVIPKGTTIADSVTNKEAMFETIGKAITVADTDGTILDGDWILENVSASQSNTAFETVDLALIKYASDLSATIS